MRTLPYVSALAEFRAYDPKATEVAGMLCDAIQTIAPELRVEHVGSTSVPGCGGKGIVDLAVLYPDGLLHRARAILDDLGCQKQGGRDPFPESRPMRVGCVEHDGQSYRIHAHVIALGSDEHQELVWFREALRASSELRFAYEERKRAILASGIKDSIEYCKAKEGFITDALKRRKLAPENRSSEPLMRFPPLSNSYKQPFILAGIQYLVVFLLLFEIDYLDSGIGYTILLRSCAFSCVAHLIGSAILVCRRRTSPTHMDLIFIRYGFIPLFGFAFCISKWMMNAKGFSPLLF